MQTRLIRIGNSQGIVLPKKLLQQYQLNDAIALRPTPEGLLLVPVVRTGRSGWAAQMQAAQAAGHEPEAALLEGFSDAGIDAEWQW